MIIGIAIGSTAIVCLIIISIACYMKKKGGKVMNESEVQLPNETLSDMGP